MKYTYKDVINYWKKLNIKTKDDYKNNLDSFSILFAFNSGVIENDKIHIEMLRKYLIMEK